MKTEKKTNQPFIFSKNSHNIFNASMWGGGEISNKGNLRHFRESQSRGMGSWEYKIFQESITFPFLWALKLDFIILGKQENSNYSKLSGEVCLQIHASG